MGFLSAFLCAKVEIQIRRLEASATKSKANSQLTYISPGNKKGQDGICLAAKFLPCPLDFAARRNAKRDASILRLLRSFLDGLAAAAAARGALRGRLANEFGNPNGRDEFLGAVIVEINRGAIGIGLGHNAETVLVVADRLPLN
jgi:hypothetical protein